MSQKTAFEARACPLSRPPLSLRLATLLHHTAGPEAMELDNHGLKPLSREQNTLLLL